MSIDSKINSEEKSQTWDICVAIIEIDPVFCSGSGSALFKVKQNNIDNNNPNQNINFSPKGIVSKIYNLNSRINLLAVIMGIIVASLASLFFLFYSHF